MDFELNNEYTPIECKYYNYKAKNDMILYFEDDLSSFEHIYICSYHINTKSLEPFLNFLFVKSKINDMIQLPEILFFN